MKIGLSLYLYTQMYNIKDSEVTMDNTLTPRRKNNKLPYNLDTDK